MRYIELLPPEKRPVAGTQGAVYRRQQMARQLPEHDQDPSKCHELSPAEVKQMQQYVRKYKDEVLGVGDVLLPEDMAERHGGAAGGPPPTSGAGVQAAGAAGTGQGPAGPGVGVGTGFGPAGGGAAGTGPRSGPAGGAMGTAAAAGAMSAALPHKSFVRKVLFFHVRPKHLTKLTSLHKHVGILVLLKKQIQIFKCSESKLMFQFS